ncbi:MAG: beta-aspartyl-peptidase [Tissierellia bacterium]|jgi:beta-aspartyl-dipeptidase (metallo-type)|nr:beta-aspartyl-peptidase [Tissierellia bacterium]
MILIKNIQVYSPQDLGVKDVFISGEKITLIEDEISPLSEKVTLIDGRGKKLLPGLIDNHVHITGGGGEGSFKTRVPEITLSKLVEGAVTTVVGLLGTDGSTRSVENLVAKAKALKEEGLSVYVHTGSYGYPSVTLTDSVIKDIVFIEEIIGVKVALSDHRSSSMTNQELGRLASQARVAGMLSGKAGIVVVHMGDGKKGLEPILQILRDTEIPIKTMRPTHVNRNAMLLDQALDFAKNGGTIDLTCGETGELSVASALRRAQAMEISPENITLSSDGYGSFSDYDEFGALLRIGVASVSVLFKELRSLVLEEGFDLEEVLGFFTTSVAKALLLYPQKGTIAENSDADLLIVDEKLNLCSVIARGKLLLDQGEMQVRGTYE